MPRKYLKEKYICPSIYSCSVSSHQILRSSMAFVFSIIILHMGLNYNKKINKGSDIVEIICRKTYISLDFCFGISMLFLDTFFSGRIMGKLWHMPKNLVTTDGN